MLLVLMQVRAALAHLGLLGGALNLGPVVEVRLEVELDGTTLTMRRRGVADPTCAVEAAINLAEGSARLSWKSREGEGRVDDLLKVGGA